MEEGLVEPEAVAPVRRVSGERSRVVAMPQPMRVRPDGVHRLHPLRVALIEDRRLLVDLGPSGVGVADQQRAAAAPAISERQQRVQERQFAAGDVVGCVQRPQRER